jgi:acyl-CoA synthetase (AMP-forming)/AMP-acid ligase II
VASFNLAARFQDHAAQTPTRLALAVHGVTYSYGDLATCAGRVAAWLRREAVGPMHRVGVLASRSLDAYAGILGACFAGSTYVPLSPKQPEARLLQLIAAADLHALIIDQAGLERLTDRVRMACPPHVLTPTGATSSRNGIQVDGGDVRSTLRIPFPRTRSPHSCSRRAAPGRRRVSW